MYSKIHLLDIEQWSQSSGSNVILTRARPGLAGLRPHDTRPRGCVCVGVRQGAAHTYLLWRLEHGGRGGIGKGLSCIRIVFFEKESCQNRDDLLAKQGMIFLLNQGSFSC